MPEPKRPFPATTPSQAAAQDANLAANMALSGQRKLIRPSPTASAMAEHRSNFMRNGNPVLTTRASRLPLYTESSRTEALYFGKQLQTQTRMVVVLEDGEHLEGVLEWHDRCAIQLRDGHRRRTLIYKSSIKYLYKAAENQPAGIMK